MGNVYFTSDMHIGHSKVATVRMEAMGHFVRTDEFPGLADEVAIHTHDKILAENWDALVKPDDIVWVLGDISAGGSKAQHHALEWIKDRPGTKHLIAGNHDGCHPMHRDSHKWQRIYMGVGQNAYDGPFASVQMAAERRVPLAEGHATVMLSHMPYTGDHTTLDRFEEWRLRDMGFPIIHGHTHSDERFTRSVEDSRQVHVGVDAWDFRPVSLEEIAALL